MKSDKEKILKSILEESPIYSGLQREERRIVLDELMKEYASFMEKSNPGANINEPGVG